MIPTDDQITALWDRYHLPQQKRLHVTLVAQVAEILAVACEKNISQCHINMPLLHASALLHDIDKEVLRLSGEIHPDTAVRVLKKEGMSEIADVVRTHPLHAILDPEIAPTSWEEKLLFLADKMVKYEIITVDKRFELWRNENPPARVQEILTQCYPKVKKLEAEIFMGIGMHPQDIASLAGSTETAYNGG